MLFRSKDSQEVVDKISGEVIEYLESWLLDEICNGKVRELIIREFKHQLDLELHRRGYVPLKVD